MISLLTNASAMSALRVLAGTQKALDDTERQVSTGLRVAEASDDAAYWSIGVSMKSRLGAVSAVQDGLALAKGLLDVTDVGLGTISTSMTKIRDDLVRALQGGVDRSALQRDIEANQRTMTHAAADASFNGIDLLTTSGSYVETTTEERVVNGATFVSEDGTDNYTLSDSLNRVSTYQDVFTVDASGHRTYSSVADIPRYPLSTISIPASAGEGSLSGLMIDLDGLNMSQGYTATFDVPPYPGDEATLTTTDISADPATKVTTTDLQYYNQARGGSVASLVAGADVFNQATALHTFTGTAKASGFYVAVPYVSGVLGDFTPVSPTDGDVVTVHPQMSVTNLTVEDQVEHFTDGSTATYHLEDGDVRSLIDLVQSDMAQVRTARAKVGSYLNGISIQREFNAVLSDALTSGVGSLVDADMGVAATRLQALQTRQRLGLQALSIANDNSRTILRLFG